MLRLVRWLAPSKGESSPSPGMTPSSTMRIVIMMSLIIFSDIVIK